MARTIANDYNEKKTNILTQASVLFASEGFSRVSMAQLAQSCDISKSNLYHYYRDKESILFRLLDAHMDEILHVLQQVAKTNNKTQLDGLIVALLELYQHADHTHRLLLNDLQVLPQAEKDTIRQKERLIVQYFKHAILLEHPEFATKPHHLSVAAMTLLGSINWTFTWFTPSKGLSADDYAQFLCDLYRQGLNIDSLPDTNPPETIQ